MNKPDWTLIGVFAGAAAGVVLLVGLCWVLPSHMEAKAFNRTTGSNVTTWDAMWAEYRIQGSAKAEE